MLPFADKKTGASKRFLVGLFVCGTLYQFASFYMAETDQIRSQARSLQKNTFAIAAELGSDVQAVKNRMQAKRVKRQQPERNAQEGVEWGASSQGDSNGERGAKSRATSRNEKDLKVRRGKERIKRVAKKERSPKETSIPPFRIDQIIGSSVVVNLSLYEEGDHIAGWRLQNIDSEAKRVTVRRGNFVKRVYVQ